MLGLIVGESSLPNYVINKLLKKNIENCNLIYDIHKSRVWTGVLPHIMVKDPRAEISEFPFNPIVALGKYAAPGIAPEKWLPPVGRCETKESLSEETWREVSFQPLSPGSTTSWS